MLTVFPAHCTHQRTAQPPLLCPHHFIWSCFGGEYPSQCLVAPSRTVLQVRLGEAGWKERYYREKLGTTPDTQETVRAAVSKAFVEGLVWVMRYYYDGVASWTWYFPFHYAPFASDLGENIAGECARNAALNTKHLLPCTPVVGVASLAAWSVCSSRQPHAMRSAPRPRRTTHRTPWAPSPLFWDDPSVRAHRVVTGLRERCGVPGQHCTAGQALPYADCSQLLLWSKPAASSCTCPARACGRRAYIPMPRVAPGLSEAALTDELGGRWQVLAAAHCTGGVHIRGQILAPGPRAPPCLRL